MSGRKDDIKFLREYHRRYRRWHEQSSCLVWADLDEGTEQQRRQCEADEERVARLADANGLDGSLFRDYLTVTKDDNPLSSQAIKRLREKIKVLGHLIIKLEDPRKDEKTETVALTGNEQTLLRDMADHGEVCRKRAQIAADADISATTLKTLLPRFENRGWINRPHGPRSGYTITPAGRQHLEKIAPQLPRDAD